MRNNADTTKKSSEELLRIAVDMEGFVSGFKTS
jgi:hypothetical protein